MAHHPTYQVIPKQRTEKWFYHCSEAHKYFKAKKKHRKCELRNPLASTAAEYRTIASHSLISTGLLHEVHDVDFAEKHGKTSTNVFSNRLEFWT